MWLILKNGGKKLYPIKQFAITILYIEQWNIKLSRWWEINKIKVIKTIEKV